MLPLRCGWIPDYRTLVLTGECVPDSLGYDGRRKRRGTDNEPDTGQQHAIRIADCAE